MKLQLLGQLVEIKTGKLDANAAVENGQYPFFTCAKKESRIDKFSFDCEAILIAGNGDLNVKRYKGKFDAYQRTYVLSIKSPTDVHFEYLYYFLEGYVEKLREMSIGGVIKYIKLGMLTEAKIPLPPLETQKQIAAVLEKADQLRKDCQQMEQELNSLAQSVFIDMFGDPVTNPKGWDKKELLSLCSKVTDGTHQSPEWAETGVPFLFISNVRNGKVDFDSGKYITRRCYEELTRTSPIEVDDILYTTVGSYGHVALVKDNFPDFCFQRHIAHIKPDPNKVIPEFLFYQLQTSGVKHLADLAVKGIAQKTLNLKDLKKFEMIVPPEKKQLELINYMNHQYQALNELEQMRSDYEMLFSSLMQKAFKGELTL